LLNFSCFQPAWILPELLQFELSDDARHASSNRASSAYSKKVNKLISRNRILLEKLMVALLFKKLSVVYGSRILLQSSQETAIGPYSEQND
jgi:hypothetical protein